MVQSLFVSAYASAAPAKVAVPDPDVPVMICEVAMELLQKVWLHKMVIVEREIASGERNVKEMRKERVRRSNGAEIGVVKHHE